MKRNLLVLTCAIAVITFSLVAIPLAGQHQQKSESPDKTQLVCPTERTGDASFDVFLQNLKGCKAVPIKHWWEFWKRPHPAVQTKKIHKEPTASAPFFLPLESGWLYNKKAF